MTDTNIKRRGEAAAWRARVGAGDAEADFANDGLAHKRNANDSLAAVLGREIIAGLYLPGSRLPMKGTLSGFPRVPGAGTFGSAGGFAGAWA